MARLLNRTRPVGEALSLPKCTQQSRSLNGSSFPTQTVGADTLIRVLAKNQGCGRLLAAPTGRMRSTGYLRKSGVAGGFYPPLQGVYAHPGVCEKPGLRADSIRPYWCGGSQGLGGEYLTRLYHFSLQISPGFVKKAESHKKYQNCQFQFVNVAAIIKAYTGGTSP